MDVSKGVRCSGAQIRRFLSDAHAMSSFASTLLSRVVKRPVLTSRVSGTALGGDLSAGAAGERALACFGVV